jgi:hypothetical protein
MRWLLAELDLLDRILWMCSSTAGLKFRFWIAYFRKYTLMRKWPPMDGRRI